MLEITVEKCQATGKTRYETHSNAHDELVRLRSVERRTPEGRRVKRRAKKPGLKRAYKCNHCDGFHLTSKEFEYFN
jgi:hypothetical protein